MAQKPELLFKISEEIIQKETKAKNPQILKIEYIDYTRNVYIFEEPWIHNLSQMKSVDFTKTHEQFKLKE
jgi:hypothetical protein